ncbi:hypothetical protein ACS0TY_028677 [Phlomoides rotata]
MADIAILVAEEYERRVKISRIRGEEIELVSCVGVLGQKFKVSSSSWIKAKFISMEDKRKLRVDSKSQMSVAAANGVFSA